MNYHSKLLPVTRGETPAELVLKDGIVLNVFTEELIQADVAISDGIFAGIGSYQGYQEIDCRGKFIVPGFIDAHVHIESSMLLPEIFAEEVLPFGTTTLIADPHEIANVSGTEGLDFMLERADKAACNYYFMLPSCVPATKYDTSGAVLDAKTLAHYQNHPKVLGLGEMMDYQGVLNQDSGIWEKLNAFSADIIDGHAPMLTGKDLQGYIASGIHTDHESSDAQEVLEKLRGGMAVLAREGSGAKNLETVIHTAMEHHVNFNRIAFCTDDKHIDDIRQNGHISAHVKKSIGMGLNPITAYQCASYNAAQIYGLRHLGAVAPGYQADFIVLNSLLEVEIDSVYVKGEVYSPPQKTNPKSPILSIPQYLQNTVHCKPPVQTDFKLKLTSSPAPVIQLLPHQINTKLLYEKVPVQDGFFLSDGDYRKIAVIERHHNFGNIGLGIVKSFPIRGAVASTVAHDSHNLVIVGDNDADMLLAVQNLIEYGGGYTIVHQGQVLETLPLPVAGLMADSHADTVHKASAQFTELAHKHGIPKEFDPFQTLSFLSLPVLPEVRITDKGVFDSVQFKYLKL